MHEMSLIQGLCRQLDRIAREHGASRVEGLTLEVGVLSNAVPELLEQAFLAWREHVPLLAEAELKIETQPLTLACLACGKTTESAELRFSCPACESPRVTFRGGEDLLLRDVALTIEEDEDERDPAHRREGKPAQVE